MSKDLKTLVVSSSITDTELNDMVVSSGLSAIRESQGFLLFIAGYDADNRELNEIPEVQELCGRLVRFGLISALEVTTGLASATPGTEGALGGFEVWRISRGLLGGIIPREEFQEFMDVLSRSNEIADRKIAAFNTRHERN